MKAITIIGTLVTVVIISFAAVMYLNAATAPVINMPPAGDSGGSANPRNAVDAARSVVSMDKDRQRDMQDILDKMVGAGTGQ
ncbi:MAG: hypothetical protein LBS35_00410 [Synergistaceae bacterium]|nr:hypothetical protein [Synergistaceae bacterium]